MQDLFAKKMHKQIYTVNDNKWITSLVVLPHVGFMIFKLDFAQI